ncbi:hypothetical protein SKAU_G00328000 [Synaphobranchus kaupii]|uniref:Uncharacterized protein n=1 Tax=Synaphobranchus kaupii TaxID=118154 RepID=A0A9Q1IK86_SYNKA|nr:hypothetical protein SKAU_G00328000 [Synaphobranchus kaupii]
MPLVPDQFGLPCPRPEYPSSPPRSPAGAKPAVIPVHLGHAGPGPRARSSTELVNVTMVKEHRGRLIGPGPCLSKPARAVLEVPFHHKHRAEPHYETQREVP